MVLLLAVLPLLMVGQAGASDVTACGTTLPANEVGLLTTDLTCAGPFGVKLEHGAVLDLNGHSITTTDGQARAVASEIRALR